jgi:putative AbiEii toxin of type IV toxin-antitoxin system/OLD-like protein
VSARLVGARVEQASGLLLEDLSTAPTTRMEELLRVSSPLFAIDEPEAHLHPTAQRQAARWIAEQARLGAGHFVFASHAPAFLSLAGETRYTHVARDEQHRVTLRAIDPRDLAALDPEIEQLGFDRGEMLALFRAVLFVEGPTDRAVVETLYASRLRELGVLVLPFHGVGSHRRILEAETLLRVLGPPFYLLVDNMTHAEQQRIESAHADELKAVVESQDCSDELRFAARIRLGGLREGRDVIILGISPRDILGTLADEAVRDVLCSLRPNKPTYPGFTAVLDEAAASDTHYDKVLRRYGVEKEVDLFAAFASAVVAGGHATSELDAVLDALWLRLGGP